MPKPLLLRRPSGLYARYWVPLALRAVVGSNYIVRSLGGLRGDAARLEAARLGYALSAHFAALKTTPMAAKKREIILRTGSGNEIVDYACKINPDGSASIEATGPEDHAMAMEAWTEMAKTPPAFLTRSNDGLSPVQGESLRDVLEGLGQHLLKQRHSQTTLGEARDLFLTQFKEKNPAAATLTETVASLSLFVDVVGADKSMSVIGIDDVDALREALAVWPVRARVRPEYKALSTRDIIKKAKRDRPPGINVRTKDKHLDTVRKFFGWAVQRHEMTHNPLSGVRLQTKAQKATLTRRGFTGPELTALFAPRLRTTATANPSYFWLPVLALHTGARLRELAQLRLADVHEVGGVWGVDINYQAGPLKNPQSQRFIPLASAMVALGFLDYVADVRAAGFDRVFPDGSWAAKNGPGDKVSKWFNRGYTAAAGLTDPALVFHSFRHTFADTGDGVGLTEAQIGALTGHQSETVLGKHYIHRKTVAVRQQHVDTIAREFALPKLEPYTSGQFDAVFAELKKKQVRADAVTAREARQPKKKR